MVIIYFILDYSQNQSLERTIATEKIPLETTEPSRGRHHRHPQQQIHRRLLFGVVVVVLFVLVVSRSSNCAEYLELYEYYCETVSLVDHPGECLGCGLVFVRIKANGVRYSTTFCRRLPKTN